MTTFSEALELAQTASDALNALEETAHSHVLSLFASYENGVMPFAELRIELLRQARAGFRTAGSVAVEHVKGLARDAGIPRVAGSFLDTAPVLERIIDDMSKNLEFYEESSQGDKEIRRLRFRIWLSVQTAVRRGFTESQLSIARTLYDRGAVLKKVWLANFQNNTPCAECIALHGTEISLTDEFSHGGEKSPKVYAGLQGPPRHPNCHCYMLVYLSTLESVLQLPDVALVPEEQFMSSKDVRRLPRAVFVAVVATLRLIAGKLKGVARGKR